VPDVIRLLLLGKEQEGKINISYIASMDAF